MLTKFPTLMETELTDKEKKLINGIRFNSLRDHMLPRDGHKQHKHISHFDEMKAFIEMNGGGFILKYTCGGIEFDDIFTINIDDEDDEEYIDIEHRMGNLDYIPF